MAVSYKKLWKILIDKDMKKKDLQAAAGISWASVTKLSKGETVSMDVPIKICNMLECDIGDVMEIIPDEQKEVWRRNKYDYKSKEIDANLKVMFHFDNNEVGENSHVELQTNGENNNGGQEKWIIQFPMGKLR